MKKLLVLITLVLGIAGLVLFNLNVQAGGRHNEWGEWEYSEWSSCQPVNECGAEGEQYATRTQTCTNVSGGGSDECEIDRVCDGFLIRGFCIGEWIYVPETQEEQVSEPCRLEEYNSCSTIRWCFPNGEEHEYYAEAIPSNEEPKEGFPWEEGMDRWCEVPEVPEVPVEPEPEVHENLAPACPDHVVPPVPTNVFVERNGADATLHWTPQGGNLVNIYILTPEGVEVGAIGDTPNDGVEAVHELNPTGDYNFELEAHQGCAGGERVRIGVVDSYLPMTFFASYARLVR